MNNILEAHITQRVADGMRVAVERDDHVVLARGERPNHTLHLIISLFTLTFWAWAWLLLCLLGGEKRWIATVVDGEVREKYQWRGRDKAAIAIAVGIPLIVTISIIGSHA